MAEKITKTAGILKRVGGELKKSPPAVLAKTARKEGAGAAAKQKTAILLSKARATGASIPKKGTDQMAQRKIQGMVRKIPMGATMAQRQGVQIRPRSISPTDQLKAEGRATQAGRPKTARAISKVGMMSRGQVAPLKRPRY